MHLKQRRQFGRPIGSFQGVQRRLAELAVLVEGSRWLAYEAAHHGAPPEQAATAAAYSLSAAGPVSNTACRSNSRPSMSPASLG